MGDNQRRGGLANPSSPSYRRRSKRPPVVDSGDQRRTLNPELAAQLRQARIDSGMTVRRLAWHAGMSKSHLWAVTEGQRVPCRDFAHGIIAVLDLDPETAEWLLDESVDRAWPDEGE
ncbi:MAG: helix-turn-helix domain-containing protein [Acidimicrobiia bacterium]